MGWDPTLWALAGWLLLALLVLTIIGELLEQVLPIGRGNRLFKNINDRIKAWWIMAILLVGALALGKGGVLVLFLFISFAALREFLSLTNTRLADSWALASAFFFVLPVQFLAVAMDWPGILSMFIPVYAFMFMPMLTALRGEPHSFLIRVAETQWSLMVSVFCVSHLPALMNLTIEGFEGRAALLILFFITVVQGSDTIQYIWGAQFGRRKVAPQLSPSKTVEGLVAGTVGAAVLAGLIFWITPFTWWQAALLGAAIFLMGFFGSLVMAAIKRDRGIREWGPLMMAQGGVTDRLDTAIFSAPIFYYLVQFFWGA